MPIKRAAAYIRVSTKSEAQCHSYEFQYSYWQQTLANKEQFQLVRIYADKGISGSKQSKREEFLAMIKDCMDGKIDVIFTKSVQRFGRNTVELLNTVRALREKGVEVIFEKENIHTLMPSAELYLTIAAGLAEHELVNNSMNQRWAYKRKFESGYISIGSRIFGYKMVENNQLEINEKEAQTIKRIFNMYESGDSLLKISKVLSGEKIPNVDGNTNWRYQAVAWILDNVRYTGNSLQQKTLMVNGACKSNIYGKLAEQYYIENTHLPIITLEQFNKVKVMRDALRGRIKPTTKKESSPFTGLMECGECGGSVGSFVNNRGKAYESVVWCCREANTKGKQFCDSGRIKDSVLKEKFVEAFNKFAKMQYRHNDTDEFIKKHTQLLEDERELNALRVQKIISQAHFDSQLAVIKKEINYDSDKIASATRANILEESYKEINEFDDKLLVQFIKKVVLLKDRITFIFYNDIQITKPFSNGKSGNKKGWMEERKCKSLLVSQE